MTTQRLRDLMDERVADVEAGDLAAPAWARAGRVRRRRRIAVVGTATAAVVAVAAGVAVLDQQTDPTTSPTGRPSSTPTSSPSSEPDPTPGSNGPRAELAGEFRGAPFWWAPSGDRDYELPALQVPGLPGELSMADDEPVTTPPARVDAVFGTAKQQYRLLADGALVSVDLSDRLGPVGDEAGNMFNPLGARACRPTARRSSSCSLGASRSGTCRPTRGAPSRPPTYEQAQWARDGELWLPGDGDSGRPDPWTGDGDVQYSQVVIGPVGQPVRLDRRRRGARRERARPRTPTPEFLARRRRPRPQLLGLGVDGRNKIAASPWAGSATTSRCSPRRHRGSYRLLAWRVGTPDLYRVSEYINVPRQSAPASWAEDAFTAFGQ